MPFWPLGEKLFISVFTALTLCVQHFRWAPWWVPHSGHKRHIKAKGTWNNIQWATSLSVGCCVWGLLLTEKAKRISGTVGTSNDLFYLGIILDYLFSLISLPPTPRPHSHAVPCLSYSVHWQIMSQKHSSDSPCRFSSSALPPPTPVCAMVISSPDGKPWSPNWAPSFLSCFS